MLCEENQPLGSSKAYLAGSDEQTESSDLGNKFLYFNQCHIFSKETKI